MKNMFFNFFAVAGLLVMSKQVCSQVVISGPTCVSPGTPYQYVINAGNAIVSGHVCITGGLIQENGNLLNCTSEASGINKVLVIWNDQDSAVNTLTVTSPLGNVTLTVDLTPKLIPATINTGCRTQVINYKTMPARLSCGQDVGGSCSPIYSYQWQVSMDMVSWLDIPGSTSQDLSIDSVLTISKFYRRKVIESGSGSTGYTDAASILVVLPPADTLQHEGNLFLNVNWNRQLPMDVTDNHPHLPSRDCDDINTNTWAYKKYDIGSHQHLTTNDNRA